MGEAVYLSRGVDGDREVRGQVCLDESSDDLENCIMPHAVQPKFHSHWAVVKDVRKCLPGSAAKRADISGLPPPHVEIGIG